jgi:hypothetical protein
MRGKTLAVLLFGPPQWRNPLADVGLGRVALARFASDLAPSLIGRPGACFPGHAPFPCDLSGQRKSCADVRGIPMSAANAAIYIRYQ